MYSFLVVLFFLLLFSLFLCFYNGRKNRVFMRAFRYFSIVFAVIFFVYWFFENGLSKYSETAIPVKVSNLTQKELDFYIITQSTKDDKAEPVPLHLGRIKSKDFLVKYFDIQGIDQLHLVGFGNKNEIRYFSENNFGKEMKEWDVDVAGFFVSDENLLPQIEKLVKNSKTEAITKALWVSFDLLLLLLNLFFLFPKRKV